MGVVFEVEDREDGRHVALKALRHVAPELMYRLKREFRAASELVHPNVISLYELFVDGADACFTMELVDGVDILTWCGLVDLYAELPQGHDTAKLKVASLLDDDLAQTGRYDARPLRRAPACDLARLRPALYQLALGIQAIHDAGFVHRDIKPSNVLVSTDGIVRVLDLGLATDAPHRPAAHSDQLVGTVAYMAPEAARGLPSAPPQDWYSFGILLFQALTGWMPYGGGFPQLIEAKLTTAPPPPASLVAGVPPDLDELCRLLLVPDPDQRPTGAFIIERLEAEQRHDRSSSRRLASPSRFTGRRAELTRLSAALDRVKAGEAAVVHLTGPSGIGKTELVRELVRRAHARDPRVIGLEGRCYPHERVTYRAIDPLIDNLSRLWTGLPDVDAHRLLPRYAPALIRLFPVLARVPALHAQPDAARPVSVEEERRRGHAALREVLQRLADMGPLVLILDDVHLVDASTVDLLIDIVREPDAPTALLVLVSRSDFTFDGGDGAPADDPLATLLDELGARVETLELPPLGHAEAVSLASRVLGKGSSLDLDTLANEAGGLPFFIIELARFAEQRHSDLAAIRVDRVVGERIADFDPPARRLLEMVAVAGAPVPRRVAVAAADLGGDDVRQLRTLRAAGLVRTEGTGDDETVEPYHERIRSAVCGELTAKGVAAYHRALALAFEAVEPSSADRLARHWLGAGEVERGCTHALRAAAVAESELDFARAVVLYQIALENGVLADRERSSILESLGEALTCTGQPQEAARAFLDAAGRAELIDALRLRSRAAGELLRGGYLEPGVAEVGRVLDALGMKLAPTPRRALINLLATRARLRLRGFKFTPREPDQIEPIELVRLDACYAVGIGLTMVDHLRGAEYNTRGLLYALEVGDPQRLARALFLEVGSRCGHGDGEMARHLIQMMRALGAPLGDGYTHISEAARASWIDNDWPTVVAKLDRAMEIFRDAGRDAGWEHDTCQIYRINALLWMGEIAEVMRTLPVYLHEARRRGDRYALANLRTRNNMHWLAADDPAGALRDLDDALAGAPRAAGTYHVQSYYALVSRVDNALYRGQPEEAAALLAHDLPALRRAHLLRVWPIRRDVGIARTRTSLALAARGDAAAAADARRMIKELMASPQPVAPPLGHLFRGLLADLCGERAVAERELRRAAPALEAMRCGLYAAAARWRLGEVVGDARMVAAARADLVGRGVVKPEAMVRMLAPSRD